MTAPDTPVKRKRLTLGPGSLKLGEVGSELDMSCQLTNARVTWEVDAEDATPTLCGGSVGGARTYTATLACALFQDIEADGVIDYSWKNKGTEVPFKFVPDEAGSALVQGTVTVDPINIGGDVRTRPTSEIEWACVGEPEFIPDSTEGGTTADVGTSG